MFSDEMERKCCAAGLSTRKKFRATTRLGIKRKICSRKAAKVAKKIWPQRPLECQEDYIECCL